MNGAVITPERRLALLEARTVNGVDFVEVDPDSPTTLTVYFVLNLPDAPADPVPPDAPGDALAADNFAITGGERITSIAVLSAERVADNQMQVIVDQAGDFSVYCLSLVDSSAPTGIPPGFDQASASARFIFHVECASDFDCAPAQVCPPAATPPPPINYLAKDFPGFVQVMLDRISLLAPAWTERNPADLGVILVEMLAYVGDQLSYRQDVIATEAYLGTARLRTSVRRHARLVDYFISEGANARVWLQVGLGPSAPDPTLLPASTRCATWYPGATAPVLPHESSAYQQAVNAGAVFFETVGESGPLSPSLAQMPLYAWSNQTWCLAPGATHATLQGAFPALAPGMVVILAEVMGPSTGVAADANPENRQAVTVTNVLVTEDLVTGLAVTEIDWAAADALTFPLCVASVTDAEHGSNQLQGVSAAWGNIVLADQGRTIGDPTDPTTTGPEQLGAVPAAGRFRPSLANPQLTFAAPVPAAGQPAAAAAGPSGTAVPAITLTSVDAEGSNPASWSPAPGQDLLGPTVGPQSANFIVEVETDGTAYLLFGDNTNGMLPLPGSTFTAVYRIGNGTSGNVARNAVWLIDGHPEVASIANPLPAWGGVDPETIKHVRQSAPVAFQTQQRAVTAADYQSLAMGYPGVQRAAATLRWTGSWHTVFITVERDQQAALDSNFIDGLVAYLDGYRMAGLDLQVEDGIQVGLLMQMQVCVQPGYVAADVQQVLLGMFSAGTQADGSPGLFSPSLLNLGQPFYLSPLIAAAQAVDGVAAVQVTAFERQDQPSDAGLLAGVLTPQPLEFFVLDNDPNYPDRGLFQLTMEGGL
jgi:Baseplate J-like protein